MEFQFYVVKLETEESYIIIFGQSLAIPANVHYESYEKVVFSWLNGCE